MKQLPDNKQSDGFSLVRCGPLFNLFIRARINTTTLGLLKRRVIVFFLFTRLPCWYFRIFLWARVLWQVSRLDLHLVPTHPDGAAGFGFLGGGAVAFMPLLLSQGTLFAGQIANRIFHEGQTLPDFKPEAVGCVIFLLFVLGPLCVRPSQVQAKRQGLLVYGVLANCYVNEFEQKWLCGTARPDERLGRQL